ncbi:MAG: methyltransferase domain-containing protein [Gemmatimonadaceae bacterium]|nr:methyltransferase domain-containing protein [Gemmatimonadaceae bacterium]
MNAPLSSSAAVVDRAPLGDPSPTALRNPAIAISDGTPWERWLDRWNGIVAAPWFQRWAAKLPLLRLITRKRSRDLFDLCSGFIYTQTLYCCVQFDLFEYLARAPRTLEEIASHAGLPFDSARRLVRAAESLDLFESRSRQRYALGRLGVPLLANGWITSMIRHHALVYEDLQDPVTLLRQGSDYGTGLSRYWSYADAPRPQAIDEERVASYSEIMATTLPPLADDILDSYDFGRHQCVLDVGGGEGVFIGMAGAQHAALKLMLFDLPAVIARARKRLGALGLLDRAELHGGNFHADTLPTGADAITLFRVLLDHDDESVLRLLRNARSALSPGGRLFIAEAIAGAKGAEPVGDAYFSFYLLAMGRGRARRAEEHHALLKAAGFRRSFEVRTRLPVHVGLIVGEA